VFVYGRRLRAVAVEHVRSLMRRWVGEPVAVFEWLFGLAENGYEVAVEYPPDCAPTEGSLWLSLAPAGGLVLHVDKREPRTGEFSLDMLFTTGSFVFPTANALEYFWNTTLAASFGIDVPRRNVDPRDLIVTMPDPEPDAATMEAIRRETPSVTITIETPPTRGRRVVLTEELVDRLRRVVKGQDTALERVAATVATQLAKTAPSRPSTVLLLGTTGTGKTTAIESLPAALTALGHDGTHVHRVDCGELASSHQIARLLGAPPGYLGHDEETPFGAALATQGCIILLDEIDRAHPLIIETALLGLLDRGRLSSPAGEEIDGAHAVIAMTTNLGADDLAGHLHGVDLANRWVVAHRCREVLLEHGLSEPLLARIGAFAVFKPLGERTRRLAAGRAILALAQEYGFAHAYVEPVLKDALLDIAEHGLGARALDHAARELLGDAFAQALAQGLNGHVRVVAGPPPAIISRL
jgi:MoxR-like ATPase